MLRKRFDSYHLSYDPNRLPAAIVIVANVCSGLASVGVRRLQFGYFVGFYLYYNGARYLWLTCFSDFDYNRKLAGLSAAVCAVALLAARALHHLANPPSWVISLRSFDRLLTLLFLLSVATVAISASYNFQLVSPRVVSSFTQRCDSRRP